MPKVNGPLIREARTARHERVEDVAPELGISPGTLRGIENMRTYAADELIEKIAQRYGLDIEELKTLPEVPEQSPTTLQSVPLSERLSYTAEEAAVVVGVPYPAILRAIDKGNGSLRAKKVGRSWIIERSELVRWLRTPDEQELKSA
jgi:excisionase family DNA binding protein